MLSFFLIQSLKKFMCSFHTQQLTSNNNQQDLQQKINNKAMVSFIINAIFGFKFSVCQLIQNSL